MPGVSPHRVHLDVPLTLQVVADEVVTRAIRLGDGWMPIMAPDALEPSIMGGLNRAQRAPGLNFKRRAIGE
jgi:hypothetical protein